MRPPEEIEVTEEHYRQAAQETLGALKSHMDVEQYRKNCKMMISKNLDRVRMTRNQMREARKGSEQYADLEMELEGWLEWVRRWRSWLEESENLQPVKYDGG